MLSLLIVLYYFPLYVQAEKSRSCDVLIGKYLIGKNVEIPRNYIL